MKTKKRKKDENRKKGSRFLLLSAIKTVVAVVICFAFITFLSRILLGSEGPLSKNLLLGGGTALLLLVFLGVQVFLEKRKRDELEQKINAHEYKDPLTGLANRKRLRNYYLDWQRMGKQGTLVTLNVRSLEKINNIFGYTAGSRLLYDVGRELRRFVSEEELAGRWKGSCFLLLLQDEKVEDIVFRISSLIEKLERLRLDISPRICDYQCSFFCGIVTWDNFMEFEKLCMEDDLEQSKVRKMGTYSYYGMFTDLETAELRNRKALENDLKQALEERDFSAWMVPQVDLHTGDIVGAETQIRWKHKDLGWISQKTLELIADEEKCSGLMSLIALEQVCAAIRKWIDSGWMPVPVFVPISIEELYWKDFLSQVRKILKLHNTPPAMVYLDISGKAISKDMVQAEAFAAQLVEDGIKLSIDHWESYGSFLNALWNVRPSAIKIDIENLGPQEWNKGKQELFGKVLAQAGDMDLRVICTGIKVQSQIEMLKEVNCYGASGEPLAAPMDMSSFEELIKPDFMGFKSSRGQEPQEGQSFQFLKA